MKKWNTRHESNSKLFPRGRQNKDKATHIADLLVNICNWRMLHNLCKQFVLCATRIFTLTVGFDIAFSIKTEMPSKYTQKDTHGVMFPNTHEYHLGHCTYHHLATKSTSSCDTVSWRWWWLCSPSSSVVVVPWHRTYDSHERRCRLLPRRRHFCLPQREMSILTDSLLIPVFGWERMMMKKKRKNEKRKKKQKGRMSRWISRNGPNGTKTSQDEKSEWMKEWVMVDSWEFSEKGKRKKNLPDRKTGTGKRKHIEKRKEMTEDLGLSLAVHHRQSLFLVVFLCWRNKKERSTIR